MKQSCTLYLIRGVCGAGKSTLAEQLKEHGVVEEVFEADSYFVDEFTGEYKFDPKLLGEAHTSCQKHTALYLSQGKSVAVSNTSTTEKEVETYRLIAQQHNALFVSLIVENRHGGVNIHNVPEDKVNQMKNRFSVKL